MIQHISVYVNVPGRFADVPVQLIDSALAGFRHTEVVCGEADPIAELEMCQADVEHYGAVVKALGLDTEQEKAGSRAS